MWKRPGLSLQDMAKHRSLKWKNTKGKPDKRRAQKVMDLLKAQKLVLMDATSKRYKLTKAGEEMAKACLPPPLR
jgi:hypothetical protein